MKITDNYLKMAYCCAHKCNFKDHHAGHLAWINIPWWPLILRSWKKMVLAARWKKAGMSWTLRYKSGFSNSIQPLLGHQKTSSRCHQLRYLSDSDLTQSAKFFKSATFSSIIKTHALLSTHTRRKNFPSCCLLLELNNFEKCYFASLHTGEKHLKFASLTQLIK